MANNNLNENITAHMLREAFNQTQREILALQGSYQSRWERMAELLNAMLKTDPLNPKYDKESHRKQSVDNGDPFLVDSDSWRVE